MAYQHSEPQLALARHHNRIDSTWVHGGRLLTLPTKSLQAWRQVSRGAACGARACSSTSARVASAASLGEVKKYCWLSRSTARSGGPAAPGPTAARRCRLRFLTALMQAT